MSVTNEDLDDEIFSIDDLAVEGLLRTNELLKEGNEIRDLLTTISELQSLHESIRVNGLTPSLLQFANTGNVLSSTILSIPSLESMSVEYTDSERDAALEGIGDKIKDLVLATIARIKAFFGKIISTIKLRYHSLNELRTQVSRRLAEIEHKQFDESVFASLQAKVNTYEHLVELLDISLYVNSLGFDLLKIKLPETREEKEEWKTAYGRVVTEHLGHFSIVHNGSVFVPKAVTTSLHGAGYTEQSFHDIAEKLNAYIEDESHNGYKLLTATTQYEDGVNQRLDELITKTSTTSSGNIYDPVEHKPTYHTNTETSVTKPEAAKILENAFYVTITIIFELGQITWVHGARNGLRTLGYLSKAYK